LSEKLQLPEGKLISSFQSRVGPTEWVGPYSDKTVEDLARKGVKKLAVLAPAFSADCVETLEEINLELRETFMENGGTHFHYIPCLNDTDAGIGVLETVARNELQGWV
jgi:ferrochelatase